MAFLNKSASTYGPQGHVLERKVSLVLKELVYGEESYYRSHGWHLSIGAGAGHIISVSVLVLCCLLCTCVFIIRTLAFGERTHPNNAGCFLLNPVVAGLIQVTPSLCPRLMAFWGECRSNLPWEAFAHHYLPNLKYLHSLLFFHLYSVFLQINCTTGNFMNVYVLFPQVQRK